MKNNKAIMPKEFIDKLEADFGLDPVNKIALNVITNNAASKLAMDREKLFNYQLTFFI